MVEGRMKKRDLIQVEICKTFKLEVEMAKLISSQKPFLIQTEIEKLSPVETAYERKISFFSREKKKEVGKKKKKGSLSSMSCEIPITETPITDGKQLRASFDELERVCLGTHHHRKYW